MDGWVKIGTELDTKSFDSQIEYVKSQMQEIEDKLLKADMGFDVGDTQKLEAQYETLVQKLGKLQQKQSDINNQNFGKVGTSLNDVGKKTDGVIRKMGKWALAVFGIRSAYMGIRRAISSISGYNEQIKADMEYIGFALATILEPIIEALIKGVYMLLQYVNQLVFAWFGVNLFANASLDKFGKMNKQARDLKKTLSGFDEMNVLGDTSGGGSSFAPSFDLSDLGKSKNKIANFWDDLFNFWEKDWKRFFVNTGGNWGAFVEGLGTTIKGFYDVFKGVFNLIAGIVKIFIALFNGDMEALEDGWKQLCDGMWSILKGLFEIIGGLLLTVLGAIKGLLLDLVGWIYRAVIKPIGDFFVGLWNGITKTFDNIETFFKNVFTGAWNGIKSAFSAVGSFFNGVFNTIKNIFKNIGQTIGNVVGSAFKSAINAVLSVVDGVINTPIRAINSLIKTINKVPGINLGTLNTVKIPRLATGGIINNPNHGVPVGGRAIGGESGAEGVIPLTDSQAMETLGNAIGRYITINANIPVNMNGRTISREIKKINTNDNFVMNN